MLQYNVGKLVNYNVSVFENYSSCGWWGVDTTQVPIVLLLWHVRSANCPMYCSLAGGAPVAGEG